MAYNFSMIPIHWLLTVDSEIVFFFTSKVVLNVYFLLKFIRFKKNYCQTGELQSKFHWKNRCRTHRFVIHAISVFIVEFTVEVIS